MPRFSRRLLLFVILLMMGGTWLTWASPAQQEGSPATLFQAFLQDIRQDMQLLAVTVFGSDTALPADWKGNTDLNSANFGADLWFDNELLADAVFGLGVRPDNWFGITSSLPEIIARNIRHDLELSADRVTGSAQERPAEWNGALRIFRCERTLQNVERLLDVLYDTRPETPQSVGDYCAAVTFEIESELLPVAFNDPTIEAGVPTLAFALRGDLERLADEMLGVNNRPAGYINNRTEGSPTLLADAAADLETLANLELGAGSRPPEWSNTASTSPIIFYQNTRHNLELLSDLALGVAVRPRGWQGTTPIERCTAIEQGLVFIVAQNYGFLIDTTLVDSPDFCSLTMFSANNLAENPPPPPDVTELEEAENTRFVAESRYAFSYLDVAALQYMGVMPGGTVFRAWYRNFNTSNMMFVSGDDFAVYIDRRFTTLPEEVFITLPTLEGIRPLTFCDAFWCNGPGPTPTPTGGGPLLALLNDTTPPATIDTSTLGQTEGKQQVSWNHIRVTYLLDRTDVGLAQVALEICAEPGQISCEPVISVFDNAAGAAKPVLSQFNGLNVYEFAYGYNNNVVIEGATLVSPDIWISDPTIR